jgi:hypothetical protein
MKILHSLAASLLSASSILARRIAFPLLFLGALLVIVQPCAGAPFVFNNTGSLGAARRNHTATLLPNGTAASIRIPFLSQASEAPAREP